jgi:hypothetical protein
MLGLTHERHGPGGVRGRRPRRHGDTLTLKAFYDHVCGIAHQLYLDGDTSSLGVRKVKALGIITGQPHTPGHPKIQAYVRVGATDLQIDGDGSTLAVGEIERLGAATLTKLAPGSATTQSPSNPSSTCRDVTPSTPTTHPGGCATSSSFATATASSPAAPPTPGPDTGGTNRLLLAMLAHRRSRAAPNPSATSSHRAGRVVRKGHRTYADEFHALNTRA